MVVVRMLAESRLGTCLAVVDRWRDGGREEREERRDEVQWVVYTHPTVAGTVCTV